MATLRFSKHGDWEGCAIALNNLVGAPAAVQEGMYGIAEGIIVPALQGTKDSGDFAANAPATVRRKGFNKPWTGITGVTGRAVARSAAGGVAVMMSGDQSIVAAVDSGPPARPLFQKAWASCEADVRDAVDSLLASAIAGGARMSGTKRSASTGRFTSSYGGTYRGGFKGG